MLFIEPVCRVAVGVRDDLNSYAVPATLLHDTVEKRRRSSTNCGPPGPTTGSWRSWMR
jgi:hypothetical protein